MVSDHEVPQLLNVEYLKQQFSDVDLLVSCGDMPAGYLEYLSTVLMVPLFYVRGNHDTRYVPPQPGGDDLHLRIKTFNGISFAGLEGSINYNNGAVQYTDIEMLVNVLKLTPRLLLRRLVYGWGVDVMVTHSPPKGIHDLPDDYAHRGFRSFRWLMRWARPRYLIHGHVDTWDNRKTRETVFRHTTVLNINPYMVLDLSDIK
ncbi:MAG: metallophosphoesterase [Anaerolineae bacterium]|nr:metallophosphoesterase [Anaerolineae bacterium]